MIAAAHRRGPAARLVCCGRSWGGVERAHCCGRFGGCGHVFDDAALWDAHRAGGRCRAPHELGLLQTITGIWIRALQRPQT